MGYNRTLKDYLWRAYFLGPDQILGGPPWLDADRFDIEAKAEQPSDEAQFMKMLQTLLVERFHLRLHREEPIGESLVLEVAKNGPQLRQVEDGQALCDNAHTHLDAERITMRHFAEIISRNLKLPVVDRTGLTGSFAFRLQWNPDAHTVANTEDQAGDLRSEMSRAIRQQLGLSLRVRRAPVEILVIDHAEKPSENYLLFQLHRVWIVADHQQGEFIPAPAPSQQPPPKTRQSTTSRSLYVFKVS